MNYRIRNIDLFVRKIPAPRIDFSIGKGKSLFPDWMRGNVEVSLEIESDDGRSAFGCSADWPSFAWLDKRPEIEPRNKLRELIELIFEARDAFLQTSSFGSPFECWHDAQLQFQSSRKAGEAVALCSSFAIALFERAVIDAFCRIHNKSFFEMLKSDSLGIQPEKLHPDFNLFDIPSSLIADLPPSPLSEIYIRHTVGLTDPLDESDLNDQNRISDGLPQTLEQYVRVDGVSFFKVKICGDSDKDFRRLAQVWSVIQNVDPAITLDGNESFSSSDQLAALLLKIRNEYPDMFSRIQFVEQPFKREKMDAASNVRELSEIKPLIIDEADGKLESFTNALKLEYSGVSHKNCKGIFKSLINFSVCSHYRALGFDYFLSAEDLTSLPLVALQQDFAVVAALGIPHAERNGHHYFRGLSHLSEVERESASNCYADLYAPLDETLKLNISDGKVDVSSLQCSGLGVAEPPDWQSMTTLDDWLAELVSATGNDN